MRQQNNFLKIVLLILILSFNTITKIEAQNSCNSAMVTSVDTTFNFTGLKNSQTWFKFTAMTNKASIKILNYGTNNSNYISTIELLSGNCNSLNLLSSDSAFNASDSLKIIDTTLSIGQVYYFKLTSSNCFGCLDSVVSNITINSLLDPPVLFDEFTEVCGLDYFTGVFRLSYRYPYPFPLSQNFSIPVSLPTGAVVLRAWMITTMVGVNPNWPLPFIVPVNMPFNLNGNQFVSQLTSSNFMNSTCWNAQSSFNYTANYRADVTSALSPIFPATLTFNNTVPNIDYDGAALIVIIKNCNATPTYTPAKASLYLADNPNPLIVQPPDTYNETLTINNNIPSNTTNAFIVVGNVEDNSISNNTTFTSGGQSITLQPDFYSINTISNIGNVMSSQNYQLAGNGTDCFNVSALGLYVKENDAVENCSEINLIHIDIDCNHPTGDASIEITSFYGNGACTPYSFLWSTSPPQYTQTATGLTPGIYTVTVTDNCGCSYSASTTINALPNLADFQITGDPSQCALNNVYTVVNPNPLYTYTWSITNLSAQPFPNTGTTVNLAGLFTSANAIITCTATYNGQCANATFTVYPCCTPVDNPLTNLPLVISNQTLPQVATLINTNFYQILTNVGGNNFSMHTGFPGSALYVTINGTFTIPAGFSLDLHEINIVLSPGAQIIVADGAQLLIGENSWLHSCGQYMWQGITVNDQGSIILASRPLIEEAILAVNVLGNGHLRSTGARFNRNYRGIVFNGSNNSQYLNSTIGWTDFTSFNIANNPSNIGVAPYVNQRSYCGIEVYNLFDGSGMGIQIGNYSQLFPIALTLSDAIPNLFNNLDFGIISDNSDLAVFNCNFYNIDDQTNPSIITGLTGTAIRVNTKATAQLTNTIIGGSAIDVQTNAVTLMPNNFIDCKRGIYATLTTSNFNNNHFLRNTYAGININNGGANVIYNADSNDFVNCNHGILARNMNNSDVWMTKNYYNFMSSFTPPQTSAKWVRMAFAIHNTVTGNVAGQMSGNDACTGFQTCFSLINVDSYSIIENNPVYLNAASTLTIRYGIRTLNCSNTRIIKNKIEYDAAGNNTNPDWRGMSIESSAGTYINENTIKRIGTGLRFFNCNAQQTVQCNNFDGCFHGVELNSSWIGDQGNNNQPNPQPSDNLWVHQNLPPFGNDAVGIGPFTNSIWWVRNSPDYIPSFQDPGVTPLNLHPLLFDFSTGTVPPYLCTPPAISADEEAMRLIDVATASGFMQNISEEMRYQALVDAYIRLYLNDSIMNLGSSSDEILRDFYDSISNSNGAELVEIYLALQNNQNDSAANLLEYFAPQNSIEEYAEIVNQAYLSQVEIGNELYEFDSITYSQLEYISLLNPIEGGFPVYQARVMIDLNVDDEYNGYSLRMLAQSKNFEIKKISMLPNPSAGFVSIPLEQIGDVSSLRFYNPISNEIVPRQIIIGSNGYLINLENFDSGIYFVQICLSNGKCLTGKLSVIK